MASSYADVATKFVAYYYNQFDADRKQLAGLYRDNSMLTFESASTLGAASITEKLAGLPFEKVKHQVDTLDAQPGIPGSEGVIILVTGKLLVDEEQRPMNYTQAFHLLQDGTGSYYVFNDIFKLVYG